MRSITLFAALNVSAALATTIFVSDYGGNITSLSLTDKNGTYVLNATHQTPECGPNPSWLTIEANRGLLFCLNEGLNTLNGSISSFKINTDGSLAHVKNETTISGPVHGVIYGTPAGQRGLAVAHYTGSAVSSWLLQGGGQFQFNQNLPYALSAPGPNAARQEAPHEHEAILDPTGQYVLVPDLGADLVRVFSWDPQTLKLKPLDPLKVAPGSGPRHAAFWNPYATACEGCTTYLYVVAELASTVTGYAVKYLPNGGGLNFTTVFNESTYGILKRPPGNAPAEVQVSPDNRFLIISNRNNTSFDLPQGNGVIIQSDSLSTWRLVDDGSLVFTQLWASGGSYPRHFSLNAVGSLVAVGNQYDQDVVLLRRDIATGIIGEPVARIPIGGNVTCVVFDEEKPLGVLGG